MKIESKILAELLVGQASTDALAVRLRVPMLVVKALCERQEKEGLLTQTTVAGCVQVWRLTAAALAPAMKPEPTPAVA